MFWTNLQTVVDIDHVSYWIWFFQEAMAYVLYLRRQLWHPVAISRNCRRSTHHPSLTFWDNPQTHVEVTLTQPTWTRISASAEVIVASSAFLSGLDVAKCVLKFQMNQSSIHGERTSPIFTTCSSRLQSGEWVRSQIFNDPALRNLYMGFCRCIVEWQCHVCLVT